MKKISIFKITFLLGCVTFLSTGFAQDDNLVQNGSFESFKKVQRLGSISKAEGWLVPTGQQADIFSQNLKITDIMTPKNVYGQEDPYEGESYAGIVAYSYNDKMPRTYLMTNLSQPLKKGQKYCVSFYVSLAEASKYATNSIGAVFSKKPYSTAAKSSIIETPSVMKGDNKVLSGQYGWDKICGVFTANGGEKYITIGNFVNNDQLNTLKIRKPKYFSGSQIVAAYYYVDDITVRMIDDITECDCSDAKKDEEADSKLIYQREVTLKNTMSPKDKIEAQAVYFAFGKADIPEGARSSLDLVAQLLKANQGYRLEIHGNLDSLELVRANEDPAFEDIDLARADSVKAYLVSKGIFGSRITTVNEMDHKPSPIIEESDNQELRFAKNRRVYFVIKE